MRSVFSLLLTLAAGSAFMTGYAASIPSNSIENSIVGLETTLFQHDYPTNTIDERLSRLEKMVFGEIRAGDAKHRLSDLVAAVATDNSESGSAGSTASTTYGAEQATQSASRTTGGNSKNAASLSSRNVAVQKPADNDTVIDDSSDYPRVTALEHELLGQSSAGEPVTKRLAAMEQKAFGKASSSNDLGERTDLLERYVEVHLHKAPFARNPEFENEMCEYDRSCYRGSGGAATASYGRAATASYGGAVPASYSRPVVTNAPPRFMSAPPTGAKMLEKVAWMEGQVYGQTYDDDHLLQRLRRLDRTLFPNEKQGEDMRLMDQVDSLIGAVEIIQHQRRQSAAPQAVASALPPGATAYLNPESNSAGAVAGSTTQQATDSASHLQNHRLLKEFAHCMGAAGDMAFGTSDADMSNPINMVATSPASWY